VFGATGNLGGLIVSHLLANGNARVRVVARASSKRGVSDAVRANPNVTVVSLEDGQELPDAAAFAGVTSVVSALQGGPTEIVDLQLKIVDAAIAAGVKRFFTSSFSANYVKGSAKNFNLDLRHAFADKARDAINAASSSLQLVDTNNGCFLDKGVMAFLGLVDWEKRVVTQWNDDKSVRFEFTTLDDVARLIAGAAVTSKEVPAVLKIAGDVLTVDQVAASLGFETKRLGNLADLEAVIAKGRAEQPNNIYAWLPLQYRLVMETDGFTGDYNHADFIEDLASKPLTTFAAFMKN
jgi:uncharacterized protein YbjT (DUF2867 family)